MIWHMSYLIIFMTNVLGCCLISYLEQKKGLKKATKKHKFVGEWPYNITMLLGGVGLIVGERLNEEVLFFWGVLISTSLVYLAIIRSSRASLKGKN